jgi:hypothetical protein
MDLPADHGLTIFTYAAEPGSRSKEEAGRQHERAGSHDFARPMRSATAPAIGEMNIGVAKKGSRRTPVAAGRPPSITLSRRARPTKADVERDMQSA